MNPRTELLDHHARLRPEAAALVEEGQLLTFAELREAVVQRARALATQSTDERIAICLPRGTSFAITVLALWRLGRCAVLINRRWPAAMRREMMEAASTNALVTDQPIDGVRCLTPEAPAEGPANHVRLRWDPDLPATVVFTSGSTGVPKAALHTLGNHIYSALGSSENVPLAPADRWLASLPLYHVGGLAILVRCLLAGAAAVFPSEEPMVATIEEKEITHLSLVSTQLRRLLDDGMTPDRLKAVLVGGGPVPAPLIDEALERGLPVHTTYGCTEMSSQITTTPPGSDRETLATAGHLLPYRELRIREDGALLVRGRTRFEGYLRDGEVDRPFDADGWYATGDTGRLDAEGRLHVTGRVDNQFISGGENIQPEAIERALEALEAVERAVVVPVPSEEFGQRPAAFITFREKVLADERLSALLRQTLPGYMVPVLFRPLNLASDTFKIDRADLAREAAAIVRGRGA